MSDSYVEISLSALRRNAHNIIEKYPGYRSFIGVVKGDAYGHGMRAAQAFYEGGVDHFAVSSLEEAKALREYVNCDILCLQPVEIDRLNEALELGLTLPIPDIDYLRALIAACADKPFKLHLQIDTGFNRLGFKDKDEVAEAVRLIAGSPHTLEGVYQHFATAGIFDRQYDAQIRRFNELTSGIDMSAIPLVHLCSGLTLLAHPKPEGATAARMGLVMYGYNVSPPAYSSGAKDRLRAARDSYYRKKYNLTPTFTDVELELAPAMSYKCRILQIKNVCKGEAVGYNAAFTADEDMRIAVLPVGYCNGIGHRNNGRLAQINGSLYPFVGAVGMNMSAVRVDGSVSPGDEVTLLGGRITLGMFSRSSGLGLAEALVSIGRLNQRVYID